MRLLLPAAAAVALLLCVLPARTLAEPHPEPSPAAEPAEATTADVGIAVAVQGLAAPGFAGKDELLKIIGASGHPQARAVLAAMLDGDLAARKADGKVVITAPSGDGFALTNPLTGEALGSAGRLDVKRIPVNNTQRTRLRGLIARLSLEDAGAGAGDDAARIAAAERLGSSFEPVVCARLAALAQDAAQSQAVLDAARVARARSDTRVSLYGAAETAFFGLSLGSVVAAGAIGALSEELVQPHLVV